MEGYIAFKEFQGCLVVQKMELYARFLLPSGIPRGAYFFKVVKYRTLGTFLLPSIYP